MLRKLRLRQKNGFLIKKTCTMLPLRHIFFKKLGFTPCKGEQPLRSTELQEKEA